MKRVKRRRKARQSPTLTGSRAPFQGVGNGFVGEDYTALEQVYLRKVDVFRKKVKFPAATDYARLFYETLKEAGYVRLAPVKKGQ